MAQDYLRQGLKDLPEIKLIFPHEADEGLYLKHASTAQIIIGWRPTKELLASAAELKLFINPGAGIKHQIELFRQINLIRKVALANGHGNSYFTAQHAVAMLLSLTNKVVPHHNWMASGRWRMGDKEGASIPLRGQRVGLLGYGAINSKVHRFLSGFDLTFSCLRRKVDSVHTDFKQYSTDQLHAFLAQTDILIIAVPETSATVDLIGEDELELLGKDGILVNVARGTVVSEQALYGALATKSIAGAALDVWYDYQPDADESGKKYPFREPFHELDNVVLSPHRSASPFSDLKRWDEVIENIKRVAAGREDYLNVVDLEMEY